jgi:hypothetical protein
MAIAAGILIAIVGTTTLLRDPRETDQIRGGAEDTMLIAPRAGAEVGPTPLFVWHPVSRAQSYALELSDESGNVVSNNVVTDTMLVLPDGVSLVTGRTYSWRVITRSEDRNIASGSRSFKVNSR